MRRFFRLSGLSLLVSIVVLVAAGFVARALREAPDRETFHRTLLATEEGAALDDGVLRFVALGDTGKGNERQRKVGRAIGRTCESLGGCAFGILLGDNIYPSGAESVDDPAFVRTFEEPYGELPFPWWVILGNHDYGGNGRGTEPQRGQVQLDYAHRNPKWRLPAPYYSFTAGPVDFFALDTNSIFLSDFSMLLTDLVSDLPVFAQRATDQTEQLAGEIARSRQPWRIALGHHPYVSNGRHGDAGQYDRVPSGLPGAGGAVKRFVEEQLCGRVHVYLSAHDHNLQDLGSRCGTEFLVSGGGAAATSIRNDRPVPFAQKAEGFLLVEADPEALVFRFFDAESSLLHERRVTKAADDVSATR